MYGGSVFVKVDILLVIPPIEEDIDLDADMDIGTLDAPAAELAAAPEHVPKPGWQPTPQKYSVLPQNPYSLQQSPKPEPAHVKPPLLVPHKPS